MFTIENKDYSIILITIVNTITIDELQKILGVLTRVFQTKKYFSFIVHCNFNEIPSDMPAITKYLVNWMKANHKDIVDYLQCSSIIIKSDVLATVINGMFKIRGPVKPNYITTDYKLGEKFVVDKMKNFLKKT